MATVTHRLLLPVGSYTKDGASKPTTEYREIGVVMEFENRTNGSKWSEVRLNLDVLNPQLFTLAKAQCQPGTSSVRVKLFEPQSRHTGDATEPPPLPDGEDDIPF